MATTRWKTVPWRMAKRPTMLPVSNTIGMVRIQNQTVRYCSGLKVWLQKKNNAIWGGNETGFEKYVRARGQGGVDEVIYSASRIFRCAAYSIECFVQCDRQGTRYCTQKYTFCQCYLLSRIWRAYSKTTAKRQGRPVEESSVLLAGVLTIHDLSWEKNPSRLIELLFKIARGYVWWTGVFFDSFEKEKLGQESDASFFGVIFSESPPEGSVALLLLFSENISMFTWRFPRLIHAQKKKSTRNLKKFVLRVLGRPLYHVHICMMQCCSVVWCVAVWYCLHS